MAIQNYGTEQLHHLMLENRQFRRNGECIFRHVWLRDREIVSRSPKE